MTTGELLNKKIQINNLQMFITNDETDMSV